MFFAVICVVLTCGAPTACRFTTTGDPVKDLPSQLISAKEFGRRLGGRSVRTIDRILQRNLSGCPKPVWVNRTRFFDEAAVDRFIRTIIERCTLPGQKAFEPAGAAAAKVTAKRARAKTSLNIETRGP
jgi:hypothetical protein